MREPRARSSCRAATRGNVTRTGREDDSAPIRAAYIHFPHHRAPAERQRKAEEGEAGAASGELRLRAMPAGGYDAMLQQKRHERPTFRVVVAPATPAASNHMPIYVYMMRSPCCRQIQAR